MQVSCRFAPNVSGGDKRMQLDTDSSEGSSIVCVSDAATGSSVSFSCAHYFSVLDSQSSLYQTIGLPLVEKALQGEKCALLAYGQTASGKTHSMLGAAGGDARHLISEHRGIIPRLVEDLFTAGTTIMEDQGKGPFHIELAFFEIYNEIVTDLVGKYSCPEFQPSASSSRGGNSSKMSSSVISSFTFKSTERVRMAKSIKKLACKSADECIAAIATLCSLRIVGSTDNNFRSSRSHAVIQMYIPTVSSTMPRSRSSSSANSNSSSATSNLFSSYRKNWGKLTLVDLAGSESLKPSFLGGATVQPPSWSVASSTDIASTVSGNATKAQARQFETKNINTSLFALKKVIHCLHTKSEHIPFKDSILTIVLEDCLWNFQNTFLLACCSSAHKDLNETIATLRFAAEAAQLPPRSHLYVAAEGEEKERAPSPLSSLGQHRQEEAGGIVDRVRSSSAASSSCSSLQRGGGSWNNNGQPDTLQLMVENSILKEEVESLRGELVGVKEELAVGSDGARKLMQQCNRLSESYEELTTELEYTRRRNRELKEQIHMLSSHHHHHPKSQNNNNTKKGTVGLQQLTTTENFIVEKEDDDDDRLLQWRREERSVQVVSPSSTTSRYHHNGGDVTGATKKSNPIFASRENQQKENFRSREPFKEILNYVSPQKEEGGISSLPLALQGSFRV